MNTRMLTTLLLVSAAPLLSAFDKSTQVAVTANTWETKAAGGWGDFHPNLTIDGDTDANSSWRAETHGQTKPIIEFTFSEIVRLSGVTIRFLKHDERSYTFDLLVQNLSGKWTLNNKLSNPGEGEESSDFLLAPTDAKRVRIIGHGNNSEKFPEWTNIVEIDFAIE